MYVARFRMKSTYSECKKMIQRTTNACVVIVNSEVVALAPGFKDSELSKKWRESKTLSCVTLSHVADKFNCFAARNQDDQISW
jgi:hypothetical protein